MLQLRTVIIAVLVGATTNGCSRTDITSAALVGEWYLQVPKGCEYGDVQRDRLVLRGNGTLEQHIEFKDGSKYSSVTERWKLVSGSSISLERRLSVPANGRREKGGEILVIEATNPPVILLDPDKNCFYEKRG